MKFRFCGDGDCPDWVLAEIISTLSILTASQLESLTGLVVKRILGESFEEETIKTLTKDLPADGKSAVACIHFLLINAARHNVSESVFNEEIQQLGLPKDHAAAVSGVLSANATPIRQKLMDNRFKINELESFKYIPDSGDAIDCATFELKISQELVDGLPEDTTRVINIERDQLHVLLDEMKTVYSLMKEYDSDDNDDDDVKNTEQVET